MTFESAWDRAAGYYLYDIVPYSEVQEGTETQVFRKLEENAWEPFEHWEGKKIFELIWELATDFQKIAQTTWSK